MDAGYPSPYSSMEFPDAGKFFYANEELMLCLFGVVTAVCAVLTIYSLVIPKRWRIGLEKRCACAIRGSLCHFLLVWLFLSICLLWRWFLVYHFHDVVGTNEPCWLTKLAIEMVLASTALWQMFWWMDQYNVEKRSGFKAALAFLGFFGGVSTAAIGILPLVLVSFFYAFPISLIALVFLVILIDILRLIYAAGRRIFASRRKTA